MLKMRILYVRFYFLYSLFALLHKVIYFVTQRSMLLIIMYLRNDKTFITFCRSVMRGAENRDRQRIGDEMNEVIIKLFTWLIEKYIVAAFSRSSFVGEKSLAITVA